MSKHHDNRTDDMRSSSMQGDMQRDTQVETLNTVSSAVPLDNETISLFDLETISVSDKSATRQSQQETAVDSASPKAAPINDNPPDTVIPILGFAVPYEPINRGRSAGIRSRLLSLAATQSDARKVAHARRVAAREIVQVPALPPSSSVPPRASSRPSSNAESRTRAHAVATVDAQGGAQGRVAPSDAVRNTQSPVASVAKAVPATTERATQRTAERTVNRQPAEGISWGAVAFIAVACAAIAAGVQEWRIRQEAPGVQSSAGMMSASDSLRAIVQQLEAAQVERDSTIALITSPSVIPIDLINYSATAPLARMYWDPENHGWLLYTFNVREPRPEKIFQVWLYSTNNSAPVSLGTMTPSASGSPVLRVTYALDPGAFQRIAVSEEPVTGSAEPTGSIVIAGMRR